MKTLKFVLAIQFSILTAITSMTPPSSAAESGTRDGGKVLVDLQGRPKLRELADKTIRWRGGGETFSKLPEGEAILAKLGELHWYFADALRREVSRLIIGWTGELISIPSEDWDKLTVVRFEDENREERQLAIRYLDYVFINQTLFDSFGPEDKGEHQPMSLIHEAIHAFVPHEPSLMPPMIRNDKIRSLVLAISDAYHGKLSREELALAIKATQATILPTTSVFDSVRSEVQTALNPAKPIRDRFEAIAQLDYDFLAQYLFYRDLQDLRTFVHNQFELARKAILEGNAAELNKLISRGIPVDLVFPNEADTSRESLLDLAAFELDPEILRILLAAAKPVSPTPGANPLLNPVDRLFKQVLEGRANNLDPLRVIELGVNPNAVIALSTLGSTQPLPILAASVAANRVDLFKILLKGDKGSKTISDRTLTETLSFLLKGSSSETLKLLMTSRPIDFSKVLPSGRVPLAEAAVQKNEDAIRLFIAAGADPNISLDGKKTLFEHLVDTEAFSTASLLTDSFQFQLPNTESPTGVSETRLKILHIFVEKNQKSTLLALVKYWGADYFQLDRLAGYADWLHNPDIAESIRRLMNHSKSKQEAK